jgi:hypothetical protein
MHVGGLDWGDNGAAVVGGGDSRAPLDVPLQVIGEFYPFLPSCSSSEDVVEFAEVETGRRNGEVEVLRFAGEHSELSGG